MALSYKQKQFAAVAVILSMFLYIPVNRAVTHGVSLELPVDRKIPFVPVFIVPYLASILYWFVTIYVVNTRASADVAAHFNWQIVIASVVSCIVYLVWPTRVDRPAITTDDVWSKLVKLLYAQDNAFNAAPSGHTFFTILCSVVLSKMYPGLALLWVLIAVLVVLSILFTKQHNVADALTGMAFAGVVAITAPK